MATKQEQSDLFSTTEGRPAPAPAISPDCEAAKQVKPERTPAQHKPAQSTALVLRVHEAAERIGLSASTLNKMRCDGRGPRFIKLTGKTVGYMTDDLDLWVSERRAMSK